MIFIAHRAGLPSMDKRAGHVHHDIHFDIDSSTHKTHDVKNVSLTFSFQALIRSWISWNLLANAASLDAVNVSTPVIMALNLLPLMI
jgi:hypothetical protein